MQSNGAFADKLYKGRGCGNCSSTGYRGRVAIHEVLPMTDAMRRLVNESGSIEDMRNVARKEGMKSLLEDGFRKVGMGITTLQEVMKETVAH